MNYNRFTLAIILLVSAPMINCADTKSKVDKKTQAALAALKELSLGTPHPKKPTTTTTPAPTKSQAPGAPKQTPAQPAQEKYIDILLDPFTL